MPPLSQAFCTKALIPPSLNTDDRSIQEIIEEYKMKQKPKEISHSICGIIHLSPFSLSEPSVERNNELCTKVSEYENKSLKKKKGARRGKKVQALLSKLFLKHRQKPYLCFQSKNWLHYSLSEQQSTTGVRKSLSACT